MTTKQDAIRDALNVLTINSEMTSQFWVQRKQISWDRMERIIRCVLTLFANKRLQIDDKQRLEQKLIECRGVGTNGTVNVEGSRIYIEGYYDFSMLQREIVW